ncbi:pentapeptide repeat-containing protein [Providencia heimbachae]|uniref:pentapeptide repeat-containing protein n=1 Tax=Providencia heimbachae TaxID=333962 RepID=UPI000B2272AC|nr:pentapeptide repeat-containing protein [Providencia heimbachae]
MKKKLQQLFSTKKENNNKMSTSPYDELENSGKVKITDKKFSKKEINDKCFQNTLFERLVAKGVHFKGVDFSYSTFDVAYLRKCSFDDCKFIGCRFVNCNLSGSSFSSCDFRYSIFEKTNIDNDIFARNCPSELNLLLAFARTLRLNYQHIGDTESANKAINIELDATEQHLKNSWKSKDKYYRTKYTGLSRVKMFFKWLNFRLLDFIWGNGESILKLIRTVVIFITLAGFYHSSVYTTEPNSCINNYFNSLLTIPKLLFGITSDVKYSDTYLTILSIFRFIMFGLFMSVLIKRLGRR